jgi:two-component system OmpR family response regulator
VKRILVVDDDPHLRDVVVYTLEREGFAVTAAADGRAALAALEQDGAFDLVVLDVLMPELDGLEVCRRLRARSRVPVVFLSSRDEDVDKIVGLELGGDDYVTKPFSPRELAARVRAVLRRVESPGEAAPGTLAASPAPPGSRTTPAPTSLASRTAPAPAPLAPPIAPSAGVLRAGPVELDPARHEVRCAGVPLRLTVTEFGVLASLLGAGGRVLTRAQLMEHAYAYDNLITERTIDTHVKRIRKKFRDAAGRDPIETVHGLGYKLRA